MDHFKFEVLVLSVLLAICCSAGSDSINSDLINSKVQRTVDLSSHLPKITNSITLENGGKTAVRSFLFAVSNTLKDHLSFVGAVTKNEDGEDQKLKVSSTTVSSEQGKTFFRVDLPAGLEAGKSVSVDIEAVFPMSLKPFPVEITQAEKQLVQFFGNLYFYSPYTTKTQTTTVNLASANVENYTKKKPVAQSESTITYGPYENRPAFSEAEMVVHYENNSPFLTLTSMMRVIEVSHWGNIAVEETFDLRHSGAALKGPFSRYDYQRSQDGVSSVKSFKTLLPSSARDVYYRDEIGNISTSHLKEQDEGIELELRPRFPLFGGWKTHYTMGYNVPSYQYLFNRGDQFVLKMRFVDHVFDDQVIEDFTVKIILPEGCSNIELSAPFEIVREPNQLHYTYLDTVGRPVIIARKAKMVESHIQDFELKYTFQQALLLQEPLLVVAAFWLLFTLVIIYVRLDFSITKDEASESRMRVAGLLEQIQSAQDRRSALYQSYEDTINKYKASKDNASFTANRKKVDADYKQLSQQISGLLSKLKAEGSDVCDKIEQLQKLDVLVKDQVQMAIQFAEKLISGKLSKQNYVEAEAATSTKREEIYQKMEAIMASL